MDKAETVLAMLRAGPLRDWATTDERLDEIAAILRREYAYEPWMALKEFTDAARHEALEASAQYLEEIMLNTVPRADGIFDEYDRGYRCACTSGAKWLRAAGRDLARRLHAKKGET